MKAAEHLEAGGFLRAGVNILLAILLFIFSTGRITAYDENAGLEKNRLRYSGYISAGSQGYIAGARMYRSDLKAFISRDTENFMNKYAYTQNPVTSFDPSGHASAWSWIAAISSLVFSVLSCGQAVAAFKTANKLLGVLKVVESGCFLGATGIQIASIKMGDDIARMQKTARYSEDFEAINKKSEKMSDLQSAGSALFNIGFGVQIASSFIRPQKGNTIWHKILGAYEEGEGAASIIESASAVSNESRMLESVRSIPQRPRAQSLNIPSENRSIPEFHSAQNLSMTESNISF